MVRAFCARFYALMDSLPGAQACRAVHPPSLERAEQRLYEYLTGWLGGPPLYTSQYGHPRLRMRHMGASIGQAEIEGWLLCFHAAWAEFVPPSPLSTAIVERVTVTEGGVRKREQKVPWLASWSDCALGRRHRSVRVPRDKAATCASTAR